LFVPTRRRKDQRGNFSYSSSIHPSTFCSYRHFLLKELERVFEYERVRTAAKLTDEEVAEYLNYIRAREVSEIIFPGPAPRIVPSDADDDPVVHTAVVGRAEILCTLNRDFFHTSVLEYCKERGVLVGSDVAILDLLRGRR
jgi:hypothetical protein